MITTTEQAEKWADRHCSREGLKSLVVGETGDIHINCDVAEVVKEIEEAGKKYFVLKGEVIEKKKKAK